MNRIPASDNLGYNSFHYLGPFVKSAPDQGLSKNPISAEIKEAPSSTPPPSLPQQPLPINAVSLKKDDGVNPS